VPIADVAGKIVLLDHFAHIFEDFGGAGDRRRGPWLEAIAEGVQVTIAADAGIAVGAPGAAKGVLCFERDKARAWTLRGQMIGRTHSGYAGARDHHVEMLCGRGTGGADLGLNIHWI
jgi:hypothetical protein